MEPGTENTCKQKAGKSILTPYSLIY